MKVSDYIAEKIADFGIADVFMVTGGVAMHLDDSLGHSRRLRVTCHHHEQACAMAAEAYARIDNRPACVLVTAGPGATNAITGVVCAYMESQPMLVLSGQVRTQISVRSTGLKLRTMGVQEFDITPAAAHMTKYAAYIERKEDVRYHLEKALYLMMAGRRGPVWLDVPLDIQAAAIEPDALRGFDPAELEDEVVPTEDVPFCPVNENTVQVILEKLKEARRPLIFAGFGVRASGGYRDFLEMVHTLKIPVITGMSSVDIMAEADPYYAGRSGMTGTRPGNFALQNCDLLLSIGSRQSIHQTGFDFATWARGAFTIINDLDPWELRKPNLHVDMPVLGDAAALCRLLLKAGVSFERKAWLMAIANWRRQYPVVLGCMKAPQADGLANTYRFYDVLSDLLGENDNIVVSCGTSRVAGSQTFRIKEGQRFVTNSSTASMGYGLPAAIGVARADGTSPVTLVTGEGSFMMNMQEMQTIATNRLPVRVFMILNGGYHSIRQTQNAFFGQPLIGVGPESGDLGFPDPEKVAACFGFSYSACRSNETIAADMAAAMALPLPSLTAVYVTTAQKTEPKTASRKLENGSFVSAPLEDLAPFLPREELAENMFIPLARASLEI